MENKEGSFGWAVEQIKLGKKVKREGWTYYLTKHTWNMGTIKLKDIGATDWVIDTNPKTLWDKTVIVTYPFSYSDKGKKHQVAHILDIIAAVREFMGWCISPREIPMSIEERVDAINNKAKEIFGWEIAGIPPTEYSPKSILSEYESVIKGNLKDGRKRALYVILTKFKEEGLSYQEAKEKIMAWNKTNQPPLREIQIEGQLRYSWREKV